MNAPFKLYHPLLIGSGGAWGQKILTTLRALNIDPIFAPRDFGTRDWNENFARVEDMDLVDCAVISTPVASHAELALMVPAEMPLFLEKPATSSLAEAKELAAHRRGLTLVDHVQLWHTGFEAALIELNRRRKLYGAVPVTLEATLMGVGPVRADCHPLWDYGVHLLAMAMSFSRTPVVVKNAVTNLNGGDLTVVSPGFTAKLHVRNNHHEKVADFRVRFGQGTIATCVNGHWTVEGDSHPLVYAADNEPRPLTRALEAFLRLEDDWRFDPPMLVEPIRMLEGVIPCAPGEK